MTPSNPIPGNPIKDSGERRLFDTGAVRDITTGKGRFDLMPLSVIADISCLSRTYRRILTHINAFTLSKDTNDLYAALTSFGVSYSNLLSLAIHYENGAMKYGEHNWQKGIPVSSCIDSAVRHLTKHYDHQHDEPHDIAFIWNIVTAIWECQNKPEMIDF